MHVCMYDLFAVVMRSVCAGKPALSPPNSPFFKPAIRIARALVRVVDHGELVVCALDLVRTPAIPCACCNQAPSPGSRARPPRAEARGAKHAAPRTGARARLRARASARHQCAGGAFFWGTCESVASLATPRTCHRTRSARDRSLSNHSPARASARAPAGSPGKKHSSAAHVRGRHLVEILGHLDLLAGVIPLVHCGDEWKRRRCRV